MPKGHDDTKVYIRPANQRTARVPDDHSERRLAELREEAARFGEGRARKLRADGVDPNLKAQPQATPETGYYGIPMQKEPQWSWEIPVYFFVGGAAGAAAVIGEAARLTGREDLKLVRDARTVALIGGLISPALLVGDLGRRLRFIYMLRVFKPQSAMSVGVYIVSGFSTSAFLTKFHEWVLHRFNILPIRFMQELTSSLSALFGFGMASYTGVLIGATAIAVWNEHIASLPIHFAMSGTSAATGILELMGNENRALNLIGIGTSIMEIAEGVSNETSASDVSAPLKHGLSGALTRLGGLCAGPLPLALRVASLFTGKENSRKLRRAAAVSSIAGSFLTRWAWIQAGKASARDYRIPLQLAPSQRALPAQSQPDWA